MPLFQSLAAFSALCSLEAYVAGDTACAGMQAFASSLRRVAALARVKLDYTGDFGNERLQALNVLPDLRDVKLCGMHASDICHIAACTLATSLRANKCLHEHPEQSRLRASIRGALLQMRCLWTLQFDCALCGDGL